VDEVVTLDQQAESDVDADTSDDAPFYAKKISQQPSAEEDSPAQINDGIDDDVIDLIDDDIVEPTSSYSEPVTAEAEETKESTLETKLPPIKVAGVGREAMSASAKDEKSQLQERYDTMEPDEKAYNILVDLGMVKVNPDPSSPDYDHSCDDELAD